MTEIGLLLEKTLPIANLLLVAAVIIFLIRILSIKNKRTFITPWRYLFAAVLFYTLEEVLAIIDIYHKNYGFLFDVPQAVFPAIEMIIICLFIYMVMIQKRYTEMRA